MSGSLCEKEMRFVREQKCCVKTAFAFAFAFAFNSHTFLREDVDHFHM